MQKALLIVAAVVALLVDAFFALVNFYPVAPERDRGPRRYVLTSFNEKQATWFQTNMLDEFNDEHHTNFQVRAVPKETLRASMNAADVALAVLPEAEAMQAAGTHDAVSFEDSIARATIDADFAEVRPDVMASARIRNRQFFLPRAIALDVAVYRISKVRDALLNWHLVRPQIEEALRAVNGRGLPADYELDQQPGEWDSYDVFVLAYYWAHRGYGGEHAQARVAHRVGYSTDAQLDLVAQLYRAGVTDRTIATREANGPALAAFQWELLNREHNLFASEMYSAAGMDDRGILRGVTRGDFFLTSVDQMQAFTLHGGSYRGALALVPDGDDLGFAPMPKFASLELDSDGEPVITADAFSFRETYLWVLPKQNDDPNSAYNLVAWIIAREDHARECEALGILPLRLDVIRERETLFREPWMMDVMQAGLTQWRRAQRPPNEVQNALGLDYAALWERIVGAEAAHASDRDAIARLIAAPIDREAARRAAAQIPRSEEVVATSGNRRAEAAFALPPLREAVVLEGIAQDGGVDGGTNAAMQRTEAGE